MGRLLIGLDEIVKGGDEAQSKVLDLAFNGKVAAFIKVAEPYSLIKGYVGERITIEEQYHLFEPVRQFGVKAFRLDRETIREIIRFGEGDCQFFKSGIGFDDQDDLIEYRTITRNYILGINEKFYGSSTSPVDLKKIKEGGVYVDDGSESDTGCDFEYIYRDALDQREFSGFVIGQNLYDSVLKGVNVYSLKMIKAMLSCSMICSAGFLARFDPRFDLCRLPWSLLHGKVLYIAYHSLVVNKSWPPQKELIYWRGHEVLPDPEGGGVFLRPRARNEYVLCSFDGQIQEIENEAKNCVVPRPVNISIKTSDLQFLVADRHLILKAVSGELDVGCRDAGESGEDGIEEVVNNLDEVKDFERYRSVAIERICDLAKVGEVDLSNAQKLIDYVAIAFCIWGMPLSGGKADKGYCRQLIYALPKKHPSYSEKLVRLIVLRFQSPKRKSVGKASELIVRSKDVDIFMKTSLPILIEAWKQFVVDRARTARKENRREWRRRLSVFLERYQIKTDYFSAVEDLLLSDQDKEDLFF